MRTILQTYKGVASGVRSALFIVSLASCLQILLATTPCHGACENPAPACTAPPAGASAIGRCCAGLGTDGCDNYFTPSSEPCLCRGSSPSVSYPSCSSCPTSQSAKIPAPCPTPAPIMPPSASPTALPSTPVPTSFPTRIPSTAPSLWPSPQPSETPTDVLSLLPTLIPSMAPTDEPSSEPSNRPTVDPSAAPSIEPSVVPSAIPTNDPTKEPSSAPSHTPTGDPMEQPASAPSRMPLSLRPTGETTFEPSPAPTNFPSRFATLVAATLAPALSLSNLMNGSLLSMSPTPLLNGSSALSSPTDEPFLSTPAIIGIAVGAAVIVPVIVYTIVRCVRKAREDVGGWFSGCWRKSRQAAVNDDEFDAEVASPQSQSVTREFSSRSSEPGSFYYNVAHPPQSSNNLKEASHSQGIWTRENSQAIPEIQNNELLHLRGNPASQFSPVTIRSEEAVPSFSQSMQSLRTISRSALPEAGEIELSSLRGYSQRPLHAGRPAYDNGDLVMEF